MAKKTKETTTTTKTKVVKPVDPVKTQNLLRLVGTLVLLLAIAAFLLQLFAVLSHHWKWQSTALRPLVSPGYHYSQPNIYEDSQLYQTYGLYTRNVKVYANKDQQVDILASTRFPRIDDGEDNFNYCLSQTSTLRGAFLTCSNRVNSPEQCHCRRYAYWNWVIVFEVVALILLGLVVFLVALQSTDLGSKLQPVAAGLAFLAFLFLLVGLILIVTHLKRETRSFADAYPHINRRVTDQFGVVYNNQNRPQQAAYSNPLRRAIHRRTSVFYRAYQLLPGQHPYNETHFQEYSEQNNAWVYVPYASLPQPAPYVSPLKKQGGSQQNTTVVPVYNQYGPVIGYDQVYDATKAGIGWSTILSILATVLSLLLPLLLAFALLTSKKLGPTTKTATSTTTNTVQQGYTAVPLNPPIETTEARTIPSDYDPRRPVGDAIVTAYHVPPGEFSTTTNEPIIIHDVVIGDEAPVVTQTTQQVSTPIHTETSQTTTTNVNA